MADYIVHLSQAEHNKEVANKLVKEPPYHDWGITAAFYSAIHYLECWLFNRPEKHTETSIPVDHDGRFLYTPHAWREKIIENELSRDAFKSFRKLRDASETARYLSLYRIRAGRIPQWLDKPAPDYFRPEDAGNMVRKDLVIFKHELSI
ncbi:MAG: hypothetical protein AB1488_06100 [Nitrospirota bacterium]